MEILFGIIIVSVIIANLGYAGYLSVQGRLYRDDIKNMVQVALVQIAAVAMVYCCIGFAS